MSAYSWLVLADRREEGKGGSGIACTSSGGKLAGVDLEAVSFVDSSSEVLVVLPFLLLVKLIPVVGIDCLPPSS